MSDEIKITELEVQKLRLRPGDVLVVKLPDETRHSWLAKLGMHLQKVLPPNVRSLLIAKDVEFLVLSADEFAKRQKDNPTPGEPT